MVSLGDLTSLWVKSEPFNENAIQYFIKNKIPCLRGNHEEHIEACQRGGKQYVFRALSFGEYTITKESESFIKNLSIGFKIQLPDGRHYLAFHNRPTDLWTFWDDDKITDTNIFEKIYPVCEKTVAVIIGHNHQEFTKKVGPYTLNCINRLTKEGCYGIITENGFEFKHL